MIAFREIPRERAAARSLLRDQEGAAYSIGFMMCVPMLMLVLALLVEAVLAINTKIAVEYAAFAAARSRIVWASARPRALADEKTRLAAVHALVPYSSGIAPHAPPWSRPDAANRADAYLRAFGAYTGHRGAGNYLMPKYLYSYWATRVEVLADGTTWDAPVTVRVRYEYPFHVAVIGRFLGHPAPEGGDFYTVTIEANATLQNEGPRNARQVLGIDYQWR